MASINAGDMLAFVQAPNESNYKQIVKQYYLDSEQVSGDKITELANDLLKDKIYHKGTSKNSLIFKIMIDKG